MTEHQKSCLPIWKGPYPTEWMTVLCLLHGAVLQLFLCYDWQNTLSQSVSQIWIEAPPVM